LKKGSPYNLLDLRDPFLFVKVFFDHRGLGKKDARRKENDMQQMPGPEKIRKRTSSFHFNNKTNCDNEAP
jgi:hypothetical protein